MNAMVAKRFSDIATTWMRNHAQPAAAGSRLERLPWQEGACWSCVPLGQELTAARDFERRLDDPESHRRALTHAISGLAAATRCDTLALCDAAMRPGDQWAQAYENELWFHHDLVVHVLRLPVQPVALARFLARPVGVPAVGFLSIAPQDAQPKAEVRELPDLLLTSPAVLVDAWDGDGYLVWSPREIIRPGGALSSVIDLD